MAGLDPSPQLIEREVERIIPLLEPGTAMHFADVDVNAVIEAIKAFKPHTACGPGGWHCTDLRRIPRAAACELALLFQLMERHALVPQRWCLGPTTYIPKPGACTVENLRPITVLSTLWRVWSRIRHVAVALHVGPMYPPEVLGGRLHHGTHNITDEIKYLADQHLGTSDTLYIIQMDIKKAFNSIWTPGAILVLRRWGIPSHVLDVMTQAFTGIAFVNRLPGNRVGEQWSSPLGLPQGDPCSALLCNCYMSLFLASLKAELAGLHAPEEYRLFLYLDDVTLVTKRHDVMQCLLTAAGHALARLGLHVHPAKLHGAALGDPKASFLYEGHTVKMHDLLNLLGSDLCCAEGPLSALSAAKELRWKKIHDRIMRGKFLPHGMKHRAHVLATVCEAALAFCPWATSPSEQQVKVHDANVLRATVGARGSIQTELAPEAFFAALFPGHRLLHRWREAYQMAVAMRRHIMAGLPPTSAHPRALLGECQRAWAPFELAISIAGIADMNGALLLRWDQHERPRWLHELRQILRQVHWRRVSLRRPRQFLGLENGIDEKFSLCTWKTTTETMKLELLKRWHCGGYLTRDRLHRHCKRVDKPDRRCPRCAEGAPETVAHIVSVCPWLGSVGIRTREAHPDLPISAWELGLLPPGTNGPLRTWREFQAFALMALKQRDIDEARSKSLDHDEEETVPAPVSAPLPARRLRGKTKIAGDSVRADAPGVPPHPWFPPGLPEHLIQ